MEQTECPTICSCALPSLVPPYGQIDRYKLIFLHPFQDSPENILRSHARTIVSFSSFNRATVIYYLRYGSSKRLTPMDRYLRYYEKCNSQARKFLSPPPPQSTLVLRQIPTSRIPSVILGYRSVTTTLQICCEFRKCARPAGIHIHVPFKRALKI